jgi:hypothetical protein
MDERDVTGYRRAAGIHAFKGGTGAIDEDILWHPGPRLASQ